MSQPGDQIDPIVDPSSDNAEEDHAYDAHSIVLINITLIACIFVAYLIKKNRIYALPESAAAILTGVVIGGLAKVRDGEERSDEWDVVRYVRSNFNDFAVTLLQPLLIAGPFSRHFAPPVLRSSPPPPPPPLPPPSPSIPRCFSLSSSPP